MGAKAGTSGRRAAARRWTKARKESFLAQLEALLDVDKAARAVGMSAAMAHACRRRDARFAAQWDAVLERVEDELSLMVLRQAREGCERTETVIDGKDGAVRQVKHVRSFSPALAMRLIVSRRGEMQAARQRRKPPVAASDDDVIERVRRDMTKLRERFGGLELDLDGDDPIGVDA